MVIRILQEWETITRETESKEDEFISTRVRLNQELTKTAKILLKAIRLYMIGTMEDSNMLVKRADKGEEFNFATWSLIEKRMRKEEKELREWKGTETDQAAAKKGNPTRADETQGGFARPKPRGTQSRR